MTDQIELTEHQQQLIEETKTYTRNFMIIREVAYELLSGNSTDQDVDEFNATASEIAHIVIERQREEFYRRRDFAQRRRERIQGRIFG